MPGDAAPLQLHVPEPTGRPGQSTDFSFLRLSAAGEVPRPAIDIKPAHTGTMAWKLIRVLDDLVQVLMTQSTHSIKCAVSLKSFN